MAREIPEVVRAAAGLAAIVLDEARKLPETLPGLPVRVIGVAMQQAMKVQQQYAGLVARGDELFTGLRGEDEPGLATFDDEIDGTAPAAAGGFRESAFDRADVPLEQVILDDDTTADVTDLGDSDLPAVDLDTVDESAALPPAKRAAKKAPAKAGAKKAGAKKAAAKKAPAKKAPGRRAAARAAAEAPATDEVFEELAIDELVAEAPPAEPDVTADVATTTDVLTAEGDVAEVEATVTDEGVAAPEAPADEAAIATGAQVDAVGAESAAPSDDPQGGSELSGSQAVGTAPIEGYDGFSIAQLRGRLRGYALPTVSDLVAYEEATRAREPYLRMLRNRLERLEAQAVEASPLAPRGA